MMSGPDPFEISIGEIFFPPALLVVVLGFVVAGLTAVILNRTRLSRFFWYPPLVFLALWVLASSLIGLYLVAP
jgi:hypothetical protein